jgi:hypothetical protein
MLFVKGQKKLPNSGRKRGTRNKRANEIEKQVALTGKTPLEVMIEAMLSHYEAGNLDKAAAFAKDAAPYVHARMASIEVGGNPYAPIEIRDMTNAELARRIALILGQAAREKAANGGDDPEPLLQAQLSRSGDS